MRAAIFWRAVTRPFAPGFLVSGICWAAHGLRSPATGSLAAAPRADRSRRTSTRFKRTSSSRSASTVTPERTRRSACASTQRTAMLLLVGVASGERPNQAARRARRPEQQLSDSEARRHSRGRRAHAGRVAGSAAGRHQCDSSVDHGRRAAELGRRTGPIRVTSLSPAPSSTVLALPGSITVGFNRELNAPSVTTATFTLHRCGTDGSFRHDRRRRDYAGVRNRARREPAVGRHGPLRASCRSSIATASRFVGTGPAAILHLERQRARRRARSGCCRPATARQGATTPRRLR